MKGLEIRIYGLVQGVGFRPFAANAARKLGLKGKVTNEGGAVHILVKGSAQRLAVFLEQVDLLKPGPSFILTMECRELPADEVPGEEFTIELSEEKEETLVFLPPDLAVCAKCLEEMEQKGDRRHRHPFISCMHCGPRYTVIDRVPYDRINTTMSEFAMCENCTEEYTDSKDRRYHAQTVSCHNCGPVLIYREIIDSYTNNTCTGETALRRAIAALKAGYIVAIKGIGGYHLACSPYETQTVQALRELKGRDAKPFAVQFPDLSSLEKYCEVSPAALSALTSAEKPIVLLPKKAETEAPEFSPLVDKDSLECGAFLPYTPLSALILAKTGPLIMTSANISDAPIIRDDEEILQLRHPRLAGALYHQRKIRTGLDDSVVRPIDGEIHVIRRARGYVPRPIYLQNADKANKADRADNAHQAPQVLACGGLLKNTFCLVKENFAYVGQHLGDLSEAAVRQEYLNTLARCKEIFKVKPDLVACDLHPDYPSTRLAYEISEQPVLVQHHHAHIASVMAEKGILREVLGLAFDGTGYGPDGRIWGGEFLLVSPAGYTRLGHFANIPLQASDSTGRECWKSAAAYLYRAGCENLITDERWGVFKAALTTGLNMLDSSSAGRLFDAASSILGLCHHADYEGEGAIRLEQAATRWLREKPGKAAVPDKTEIFPYEIKDAEGMCRLDFLPLIARLAEEKSSGRESGDLAAVFHHTLVKASAETTLILCAEHNLKEVVLSGGVFQNVLFLTELSSLLKKHGLLVHTNILVPPNDGGISLGQAYAALHQPQKLLS